MSSDDTTPATGAGLPEGRRPFAVWLLPDQASSRRWQLAIDRFATARDAPVFDPHLTVHVGHLPALLDPMPVLRDVAGRGMPLILEAGAIDGSDRYFKSLFVPFRGPSSSLSSLETLREDLVGAWLSTERLDSAAHEDAVASAVADYPLEPHLSLLYANLDEASRQALAREIDTAGVVVRFDRVAIVTPRPGARDLGAVDRWEISEDCRLGVTTPWRDGRRR